MSSRYPNTYSRDPDRQRAELFNRYSPSPSPYASSSTPSYHGAAPAVSTYRSATPNAKHQYSADVLENLESQNDERVEGLSAKVRMLKDITVAIGDEVRSSTSLMDTMNQGFEGVRDKLGLTMRNMLRMAKRTGVGWRVWLLFMGAVVMLFWWVWI